MSRRSRVGPYGEQEGSILDRLNKLPKDRQRLFRRNLRKNREDERAMKDWADDGFTSSGDEEGRDYVGYTVEE